MAQGETIDKKVIGLYGEMRLAMELHQRGWQVYRAYIDETIDFVIMKMYCDSCEVFRDAWKRETHYQGRKRTAVTNLCEVCHGDTLRIIERFIQVKTSEGVTGKRDDEQTYSFHPKIRYHLADGRVFYVWVQVWDEANVNFYIFRTSDVERFDNTELGTYQVTDNQKTNLRINRDGEVLTRSKYGTAEAFREFHNDFDIFDELVSADRPRSDS